MRSFFSSYIEKSNGIFILLIALLWVLVVQNLFCHGMFLDGIVYSTIARNFALENNGFWLFWVHSPDELLFRSHPPLAFWLQAALFWLFGDHFWLDRLYSILCLLVSLFFIKKIWAELVPLFPAGGYWVQFIYCLIPLVSWSFNNNLLENTTNCFTLLSIWLLFLQKNKSQYFYGILAGLSIWGATMVKGPVGLFPLAFPVLHYLCFRQQSFLQLIVQTIVPFLTLLLAWVLLYNLSSDARLYFSNYIAVQLIKSVGGQSAEWYEHFFILPKLLIQLSPLIGLSIVLHLTMKKQSVDKPHKQYALLFLLLGLSASLPIMVSPKQLEFYILPSLIYFAIAFVFFHFRTIEYLHHYIQTKRIISILGIGCIALSIGWTACSFGTFYRDEDILNDVFTVGSLVPPHNKITASEQAREAWSFRSYLSRYFYLYIQEYPKNQPFYIALKGEKAPKNYQIIITKNNFYSIYSNTKQPQN